MCFGGGSNKAADEANRQEKERMARIAATQASVNQVFDSPERAAEIMKVVQAFREQQTDQLNEQQDDARRELKFSLARGGNVGGSLQADLSRRMSTDYQRALLGVESRAQGYGSKISAADQDARARLISLATSGLDATTAASQSAAALRSNIEGIRSEALASSVADPFSSFSKTFTRMREDYDRRRGLKDSGVSQYGKVG